MKLVDILARELDRWPEGMSGTVGQGHTGYLHGYAGSGHPNSQTTRQIFTMCDDYSREKVTRAEWQAAVDALKQESPALHVQVAGRGQRVIPWDGEGLPPVGTVCEWLECKQTGWQTVEIAGYFRNAAWIVPSKKEPLTVFNPTGFRPIRTAEQIAAEAYQNDLRELASHIGGYFGFDDPRPSDVGVAEYLLDHDYRKQVQL